MNDTGESRGKSVGPIALALGLGLLIALLFLGIQFIWRARQRSMAEMQRAVAEAAEVSNRARETLRESEREARTDLARAGVTLHRESQADPRSAVPVGLGITALLLPDLEPLPAARLILEFEVQGEVLRSEHRTDSQGRLELPFVDHRRLLEVRVAAGQEYAAAVLDVDAWVLPNRSLEVQVPVSRGRTLEGTVVDAAGDAVPNARVLGWCRVAEELGAIAADPAADADRREHADASGRFTVPRLGPEFTLEARSDGAVALWRATGRLEPASVGEPLVLMLKTASELRGRVIDETGAAVPNAVVRARVRAEAYAGLPPAPHGEPFRALHSARARERRAVTDREGRFVFEGLLAELAYQVEVESEKARATAQASAGGEPLLLILGESRTLAGRILGPAGEPALAATVGCLGHEERVRVAEDGAVELILPPGFAPASVYVQAPDCALAFPFFHQEPDPGPFELQLEREASIFGRILDPKDQPLANLRLELQVEDAPLPEQAPALMGLASAQSNARGEFAFPGLPAGTYRLRIHLANLPAIIHERSLDSGAAPHSIVLHVDDGGELSLSGVVRQRDDGQPVRDFVIEALRSFEVGADSAVLAEGFEGLPRRFRSDEGRFVWDGLQPGSYRLTARAGGFAPQQIAVDLPLEQDRELEFLLVPERRIELSFSDPDGLPLKRASIRVRRADGNHFEFRPGAASDLEAFSDALWLGPSGETVALLPCEGLELDVHVPTRLEPYRYRLDLVDAEDSLQLFVVDKNPELFPGRLRVLFLEAQAESADTGWLGTLSPELEERVLAGQGLATFNPPAGEQAAELEVVVRDRHGAWLGQGTLTRDDSSAWGSSWRQVGAEPEAAEAPSALPVLAMVVPRDGFQLEVRAEGYEPLTADIPALAGLDRDAQPALVLARRSETR